MTKYLFTTLLSCMALTAFRFPETAPSEPPPVSPLASYSPIWNQQRFLKCNTAASATFLSAREKEIIYILNLARTDPALFNKTVVMQYPEKSGNAYLKNSEYYKGLVDTLSKVRTLPLLKPDLSLYTSAQCHALSSGAEGYVGHDRLTKECEDKQAYSGECCHYGYSQPIDIVMSLLIDENVPSLGHRILLLSGYKKIGVSLQTHQSYGYNTVVDLGF